MNAALKSKKGSDSIVSPNRYAILSELSSTDHVTPPTSANIYIYVSQKTRQQQTSTLGKRTRWDALELL